MKVYFPLPIQLLVVNNFTCVRDFLTEDIFGVLRRWSLIGGGRLQEVVASGHSTGRMSYFI